MLMQDPYMALLGFAVAPPAMLVLRKLVKRIKGLAHNQFTGTADIHGDHAGIAAGHPHRQGIHARSRPCASASTPASRAVERNANKMARVSNRSSPLMETLGGFAVATGLMYGGYAWSRWAPRRASSSRS